MRSGLGNMMADTAVTEDVTLGHVHRPHAEPTPESTTSQVSQASSREPIRNQVASTHSLGSEPETTGLRKRDHLGRAEDLTGAPNSITANTKSGTMQFLDPVAHHQQMILEDAENQRQHLNHKVARTRIKAALYEFYRSLEMLKNYKVRNRNLPSDWTREFRMPEKKSSC